MPRLKPATKLPRAGLAQVAGAWLLATNSPGLADAAQSQRDFLDSATVESLPVEVAADTPPETTTSPSVARPQLRFDQNPFNVQLRLGMATTVGSLGLVAEYDISDQVNVGLGVGTNLLGVVPGAHVRLRPFVSRNASGRAVHGLFVESGASVGRYVGSLADATLDAMCEHDCGEAKYRTRWVTWGQIELGWEMRWSSGALLRASSGMALTLPAPRWQCTQDGGAAPCDGAQPSRWAVVYTFAAGYAF